jgi:hypothetical protein
LDQPANGGNGDQALDERDESYGELRLWIDANHNGFSEPEELLPLQGIVRKVDLHYETQLYTDGLGNWFLYRARVKSVAHGEVDKWAWDVYLGSEPVPSQE